MHRIFKRNITIALLVILTLTGCTVAETNENKTPTQVLILTSSAITENFAETLLGNYAEVKTLVPNGFDSHTYEPKPSELALISKADLIIIPDQSLNPNITGLLNLYSKKEKILYLNQESLTEKDFIYRKDSTSSANPHTWTSPILASKWINPLKERIIQLLPAYEKEITANASNLQNQLKTLDNTIRKELQKIPPSQRKIVVYHDAWEYFGREYDVKIVGAIQAINFAEPTPAELANMVQQIKKEKVKAFFGSEVFPSDVLEALEAETGVRYIPDLADDKLPGTPGSPENSYINLMYNNVKLILTGLA